MAEAAQKKDTGLSPLPTEAGPIKHPLDVMMEADEAEIKRLSENPSLSTQTQEITEEQLERREPEPSVQETPVEEPPAQQPPTPVEEPPTEEHAAKEPPLAAETKEPEKREYKGPTWKQMRELQKANRELEATRLEERSQFEQMQRQLADEQTRRRAEMGEEEEEIEDPLTKVNKDIEALKQGQQQTREHLQSNQAVNQQRDLMTDIERQEESFTREHPDYNDACNYLAETEREEYEIAGILDSAAREMLERNPEIIEQHMQATQMDDEYEAAKDVTYAILLNERRKAFVAAATRSGKNVPAAAYDLAKKRGYQAQGAEQEMPKQPAAPPPPDRSTTGRTSEKTRAGHAKPFEYAKQRESRTVGNSYPSAAPRPRAGGNGKVYRRNGRERPHMGS